MKKIKFNLPAFSLAEALITLLIVCLITLASIPVLTKKKRSVNELASGKWMCTLNSTGQYVVYSSSDPHGDIKDPDTWRVSSNQRNCTFIPPQNAKNFGVTIIGGGGGGRDGFNEMKTYLDDSKHSYTVEADKVDPATGYGVFRLAVIGNGGGCTGSDDSDGCPNCGVGGQGGGGAYFVGEIKLHSGWTVSSSVSKDDRDGARDSGSDAGWPGVGADKNFNVFSIEGNEYMKAGNGRAGRATKNSGGADPKGGDGGKGGSLVKDTTTYGNLVFSTYAQSNPGKQGRTNSNCRNKKAGLNNCDDKFGNEYGANTRVLPSNGRPCYGKTNGIKLGKFYNDKDNYEYGLGGFGCKYNQKTGMTANYGTVKLWQIIKRPGGGGGAAKLTYHYFPNIKGKLVATIGKGGDANSAGVRTSVQVYNLKGIVDRTIYGDGGAAGVQGNIVSKDEAKGEVGEDSLWLGQGGGGVGTCTEAGWDTEERTKTEEIVEQDADGNPICLVWAYFVGPVDTQITSTDTKVDCPYTEKSNPPGFCVTCSVTEHPGKCKFKKVTLHKTDGTTEVTYRHKLGDNPAMGYNNKIGDYDSYKTYSALKSYFTGEYLSDSWNLERSSKLTGYKFEEGVTNTCLVYETKKITSTEIVSTWHGEPSCSDSLPGTYFGAGGGGGSVGKTVGVFGKGGKGAPGAVIIEW